MNREEFFSRIKENPNGYEAQLYNLWVERKLNDYFLRSGLMTKKELRDKNMGPPQTLPSQIKRVFDPKTGDII